MIKIKLECWWTNTGNLQRRFINQFVPKNDLEHYSFVTENPDYTIIFGRTDWEQITTPKDRTFYFSQEPLWSPNEPKIDISNYCSKIFVADKLMYTDKDEYIEGLFPMFYGGRGDEHNDVDYCWDLRLKEYEGEKTKNVSVIVRKDYYTHYNNLEKPDIFMINYIQRTDLGIELSKNDNIDVYGTYWENNGKNLFGEVWNKRVSLNDYRFSIACENTIQKNYISEKFWDVVLTNGVPIYLGCNNIHNYIPKDSFIYLNDITMSDMVETIDDISKHGEDLYDTYKNQIKYLKNEFFTNPNFNLWVKIKNIIE
jgi:hypothetical protein